MKTCLRFEPGGQIGCLYSEAMNLRVLGRLHVVRATDIRFNDTSQQWEVSHAETGAIHFAHPFREACLQWEQDHLRPDANGGFRIIQPKLNPESIKTSPQTMITNK